MDKQALIELATQCEAATGPDRELDCLIACRVNDIEPKWQGKLLIAGEAGVIGSIDPGNHQRNFSCNRKADGPGSILAYTASLDAAMTLVPEGHGWLAGWGQVTVAEPMGGAKITRHDRFIGYSENYDTIADGEGATPALALCAAALRARAA